MGTLPGGNGEPPAGGGPPDGMPGLPPEWGPIVIPDDASELDDEAAAIRREMKRDVRRYRWRRRLRGTGRNGDTPSLGAPLAIMAIAMLATLISLFAVVWPGAYNRRTPSTDRLTTQSRPLTLPDLVLEDADQSSERVRIREHSPAVVVLVDGCRCDKVVADTRAAVDPRVTVLVVWTPDPYASTSPSAGSAAPWPGDPSIGGPPFIGPGLRPSAAISPSLSGAPSRTGPPGVRVRSLLDPAGTLRAAVPGLPRASKNGVILLVNAEWAVIRVVETTTPIADLKPDLDKLAG
jgi:hypothetical protein